ncbi:hypothetical protein F7661_10195 [Pseudomonas sp. CFA]|nr:hypothetical protein F7661_10195 [Pseudomonas sp. CFA]
MGFAFLLPVPASIPWRFGVPATTVFAGEPAPTRIGWWTHIGGWAQAAVGAGSPAKRPPQESY